MTEVAQRPQRDRKKLWLAFSALVVILFILIIPPLVSIGRYKSRITELVSISLGRPVHLSSVGLRLLPWPGFVLTDLTVEEDPAFGAEPVLHASTVTTGIRLLSLWRGRLEISRISVDDASLNLVRNGDGHWNLDPLFRTAAARSSAAGRDGVPPLPYLEATNSRVNIKKGLEKLPYSLVNSDLSFWQENPGEWRVRLRAQPARTDVSLDLADTGVVQLDAEMRRAADLHQMLVHLDLEWREAQLGQLSRLLTGSDAGWRGDLTGELHLDGTAESAQVKTRLSATGVHRAEFTPNEALDFDANCGLTFHYSSNGIENLNCDSPLGEGHIRMLGTLPGSSPPRLSVELQRIPVQAGLDLLRTLRSDLDEDLEAKGTVSGKIAYDPAAERPTGPKAPLSHHRNRATPSNSKEPAKLFGSLTVDSFSLSGSNLSQPFSVAKMTFAPATALAGRPPALTATVALPAGGLEPLVISVQLALNGYQVLVDGPASLPRIRDLAHIAGRTNPAALDSLAGGPPVLDLSAQGPWLPAITTPLLQSTPGQQRGEEENAADEVFNSASDGLSGTVTLHNAIWKTDSLSGRVEISDATLQIEGESAVWDPVVFTYGPVKGTASLKQPHDCESDLPCPPQLEVHFAELDAAKLQAALLGAQKPDTLLSTLIARLTPSQASAWPRIDAAVTADVLRLGPIDLQTVSASLRVQPAQAEITSFDARLLGGQIHATGTLASGDKPAYDVEGTFEQLSAPAVCQLLAIQCTGGPMGGDGKVALSGFTDKDLAGSAKGTMHFDWLHGSVIADPDAPAVSALSRFSRWSADAEIGKGAVTLKQSQVQQGTRNSAVDATITFGAPPKISFAVLKPDQTAKR